MFLLWYYLYLYFNFCTYQDCERVRVCAFSWAGVCTGYACECKFSPRLKHWNQSKDNLNLVTHICDVGNSTINVLSLYSSNTGSALFIRVTARWGSEQPYSCSQFIKECSDLTAYLRLTLAPYVPFIIYIYISTFWLVWLDFIVKNVNFLKIII